MDRGNQIVLGNDSVGLLQLSENNPITRNPLATDESKHCPLIRGKKVTAQRNWLWKMTRLTLFDYRLPILHTDFTWLLGTLTDCAIVLSLKLCA